MVDEVHEDGVDFVDLLFFEWSFGFESERRTHACFEYIYKGGDL